MRQKVMAYIVREAAGRHELLVFRHRDHPEAGVQVPAGTVEPGEAVVAALLREVEEEAGLPESQLRLLGKVAEAYEAQHNQQRHVFVLAAASPLPESWSQPVQGAGDDAGLVFDYFWVPIAPGLRLAGGQEQFLDRLDAAHNWAG